MRKLVFGAEARGKLMQGVEIMFQAVTGTLGPKGRNVGIDYDWRSPIIVHDGVTVAREVMDKDEFINLGINIVKEAANRTNDDAGDGTTTSTLLAYWIAKYGNDMIDRGVNAMILRDQINEALFKLQQEIKKIAIPVKDDEDIENVAFISSASVEIGKLVTKAVRKVGKDGLVTVEEGKGTETFIDYTEGMEFEKGYSDYRFVTDPKRMEATIHDALVVVIDKKLTIGQEVANMLEVLIRKSKNIVLIGDITGSALATALLNKMQGNFNVLVVHPPTYGDRQKEYLDDIALITGAKVLSDEIGIDIKEFNLDWVGTAKTVKSDKDTTIIIGGGGKKDAVKKQIEALRVQRNKAKQIFEKEKIEERLAKLTTGVAVIKVGAKTDIEMREKVERVKDAIGAAKAAIDEGIVPGGGVTFLRLKKCLKNELSNDGIKLLLKVLDEPVKKILYNAGITGKLRQWWIIRKIQREGKNIGYEMNNGQIMDLVKIGVIDPAKVIRLSLENAISVAGSILTTECLIVTDIVESRKRRVDGNGE